VKTKYTRDNRNPSIVSLAEKIAPQFWSDQEEERATLLKQGAHRYNILHSLPILIENAREKWADGFGATEKERDRYGLILELNLECINYHLRLGERFSIEGRRWGNERVEYFDSEQFSCSKEVCELLDKYAPYSSWLLKCIALVATEKEETLKTVFEKYLEEPEDDPNSMLERLWIATSNIYPFWSGYDISPSLWAKIVKSPRRFDIIAVLGKLNKRASFFDKKGCSVQSWACGVLETHVGMALQDEALASIPAFGNAVMLDAIFQGLFNEDFEKVRQREAVLGARCGAESKCRWRVDEYTYNRELCAFSCRDFILRVPSADRCRMRLFVAAAGLAAQVALRDKDHWPKAVLKKEIFGEASFLWLLGEYEELEVIWKSLIERGALGGSWDQLRANEKLLIMFDYSDSDRNSLFIADGGGGYRSWPRESWLSRSKRRLVSQLIYEC
jgi:hypothetical protein